MPLQAVADCLKLSPLDVRQVVTDVSAGGIVTLVGDAVAVNPPALRPLLVKRVFFDGAGCLPLDDFIGVCPSKNEVAHVLLHARRRGAAVSPEHLAQVINENSHQDVWMHMSIVDEQCARQVLSQGDRIVVRAAAGLLRTVPDAALARLLDIARTDLLQAGAESAACEEISKWIRGDYQGHLVKRTKLLGALERFKARHGDAVDPVLGRGIGYALSPAYERHEPVPGIGNQFQFNHGIVPIEDIPQVAGLWRSANSLLPSLPSPAWRSIMRVAELWCVPRSCDPHARSNSDLVACMTPFGQQLLEDLVARAPAHRAVRSWAVRTARLAGLKLDCRTDPDFETLFCWPAPGEDWEYARAREEQARQRLAAAMVSRSVNDIADEFCELEREAAAVLDGRQCGNSWLFYTRLAEHTADPAGLAKAFIARDFDVKAVVPLLNKTIKTDRSQGESLLDDLLHRHVYRSAAVCAALSLDPPSPVTDIAVAHMEKLGRWDAYQLAGLGMPAETAAKLLEHQDRDIRSAAALAVWLRASNTAIPPELEEPWRRAIVEAVPDHDSVYALTEVLSRDAALAMTWAKARFADPDVLHWGSVPEIIRAASPGFELGQRRDLLGLIDYARWSDGLFDSLVGDDATLVAHWFETATDTRLREQPLCRGPSDRWAWLAGIALEHGFTSERLADLCEPWSGLFRGHGFEEAKALQDEYRKVLDHPDARLHATAHKGIARTNKMLEKARQSERAERVYGFERGRQRHSTR